MQKFLIPCALALAAACTGIDVGKPCDVGSNAITGACRYTVRVVPSTTCMGTICTSTGGLDDGGRQADGGVGGYCTIACAVDDDCPDSFLCRVLNNTGPLAGRKHCVEATTVQNGSACSPCQSDGDCITGLSCRERLCAPPPCTSDTDCAAGRKCQAGACA